MTGQCYNQLCCGLYINNGQGSFSLVDNTPFDSVKYSTVSFSDVDNDGNQDLLITGMKSEGICITKLYKNLGGGVFEVVLDTPFDSVCHGAVMFFDADNDEDQDLFLTGRADGINGYLGISKLYINDGFGDFSEMVDLQIDGISYGSVDYADIDNDGDNDILVVGHSHITHKPVAKIYRNLLFTIGEYENNRVEDIVSVYPNPSQNESRISYYLANDTFTIIDLYDINGKQIMNIENGIQSAGNKHLVINISSFPSGIYICKMSLGGQITSKKIVKL